MANDRQLDQIDTKEFFRLLAGKVEVRDIQLIAAAMAESVARGGVRRVADYSSIPQSRLASIRANLRKKRKGNQSGLNV